MYRLVGYLSVSIGVTCVWVKPRLRELILKESRSRWERSPNVASVLGVLVWHHFGLMRRSLVNKEFHSVSSLRAVEQLLRKDRFLWMVVARFYLVVFNVVGPMFVSL